MNKRFVYWFGLFALLIFVQTRINASTVEWLSADIGFLPNSETEKIQAVQLSEKGAQAVDLVVSDNYLTQPQIITSDRSAQSEQPPVRATGLNNMLILPCAFADQPVPSLRDSYFSEMRDELRDYWLELSYNRLDIGVSEVAAWQILPLRLVDYQQMDVTDALTLIFEQCTTAANMNTDFSDVSMINILLNESLGASWAGQRYAELDGKAQLWPVSWNMDWAWERSGRYILKHEMGHLFGMSHSIGKHGSEYGNAWDMMSQSLSQHTVGYNKMTLGWLDAADIRQINAGQTYTHTLTALASAADGVKLLTIPVTSSDTDTFTVEFRQTGKYDRVIPGTSVVIHEIDHERVVVNPISQASQIIPVRQSQFTQESIHNGDSLWEAGETFVSPEGVEIEIIAIDTNCDDIVCGSAKVRVTNPGYSIYLPTIQR